MITAHPPHLDEWHPGKTRSRWDYDCPDHTLEEMMEAGVGYFSRCADRLRAGDLVYVTDAANKRATLIINWTDVQLRQVAWDIDAVHSEKVVAGTAARYTIRWRGPRGGHFCILDNTGEIIARDIPNRAEADRRLANMMESKAA